MSMSQANGAKCARAQYHVMRKAAASSPDRYAPLIADRLWGIAGVAGRYLDWETADEAVALAVKLNGRTPSTDAGSSAFRLADRKSTRLNSSHVAISYAVFCLKKKINGLHRSVLISMKK